jgi:hypothetical protein
MDYTIFYFSLLVLTIITQKYLIKETYELPAQIGTRS